MDTSDDWDAGYATGYHAGYENGYADGFTEGGDFSDRLLRVITGRRMSLTDEQVRAALRFIRGVDPERALDIARAIERAHGIIPVNAPR